MYALDRTNLRRCLACANGKGGVGKTSTSTHVAGLVAAQFTADNTGQRVLLIDLDPQGNTAQDLGYGPADLGASMLRTYLSGGREAPLILRDVRHGLDVIPGGRELAKLADAILLAQMRERDRNRGEAVAGLAAALAAHVGQYDLVVIDCPPANTAVLQDAALDMAQYLLIPTKTDKSSRDGLAEMAERFGEARSGANPELTLLGVVLFGVTTSASNVRRIAREWIEEALQGQAPVFHATVRHVEAAAFDIRQRGRLAHELEAARAARAGGDLAASATGLAADYQQLAAEVLTRVMKLEAAA